MPLLTIMPDQSQNIRRSQRLNRRVVRFAPLSTSRTSCRTRATVVRLSPVSFTNKSYY